MASKQQKQTLDYFKRYAQNWNEKAGTRAINYVNIIKQRNDFVLQVIDRRKSTQACLDIGCGTGDLAIDIAKRGISVTGVDFSDKMISLCRKNASKAKATKADFACASFFDFPLEKGSYDVMSANGFIEYISFKEMENFLRLAARGLRKGGSLVFGSRNRLFNIHSLNAFTIQELDAKTVPALVKEATVLAQAKNLKPLEKLKTVAYQPPAMKHAKHGVTVATRFQYTPAQLIQLVNKFGFKSVQIFPIHLHCTLPAVEHDAEFWRYGYATHAICIELHDPCGEEIVASALDIAMYHYVRTLEQTRYPSIKGLHKDNFVKQLRHFRENYNVIKMEQLIDAVVRKVPLPERALLLTFDDAYIDHYDTVFPILDEMGMQGSFFPPGKAIATHTVLDVNKIHFLLASVTDTHGLVKELLSELDQRRSGYDIESNEALLARHAQQNRWDSKEVIFIKRLLQKGLPLKLRAEILDELFRRHVTKNEVAFSSELYMNSEQLKCMKRHGMFIGSHGYDHFWLNTLDNTQQREEIRMSLEFLKSLGVSTENWVMCFPYGAYNDSLLENLKSLGCAVGLSTEARVADISKDMPLALPRLDTNDYYPLAKGTS